MSLSKEFKVGTFMVFAIAVLYIGFNYLKGVDFFSTSSKYYAVYSDVNGLSPSNPVLINGFSVGRVSQIKLLQSGTNKILVELDISGDIVLGDSATAKLNSDFLGNKSILLHTGNINKPIEPKDTIIAIVDKGITAILAESAQPVANNLESTIKKINIVLDQFASEKGKIDSILNNIRLATHNINYTIRATRYKIDTVAGTYNQLGLQLMARMNDLKPMLGNMTQFSDSLKSLELNKTLAQANHTLEQLDLVLNNFARTDGTLGKLMSEDSLYVNLNNVVMSLDKLLIHMNTEPKHFFAPLGKSRKKIERDRRKTEKGK